MLIFNLAIIALIQGITEFLPVSSSAHLILLHHLSELPDQGQTIDIAVHFGTLLAVITYFWRDTKHVCFGLSKLLTGKISTNDSFVALCLVVATIPAMFFGLAIKLLGYDLLMRDNVLLIGVTMTGFGFFLWWSDSKNKQIQEVEDISWSLKNSIKIGCWQALALIPGTSRSGITISAARILGYSREHAVKISMLLSIPVIIAASALSIVENYLNGGKFEFKVIVIALIFSYAAAYLAISIMLQFLQSLGFLPYIIYRIMLGIGLILWTVI
tara:strand:+ start:2802 stop:3614 length:813 start_codon:yes stop_codon:yes gene_type:complete